MREIFMAKKKQKELHELIEELSVEYQDKREFIRQYDNSKFSEPNWYGRKEYAHMTPSEVDARLVEITMEKAKYHG